MIRRQLLLSVILVSLLIGVASAEYYVDITIDNGFSPYQANITLSNSTGTNNITNLFLNGHAGVNYSSVYFTTTNRTTTFNHYIDNVTGKAYINRTQNGTIRMWYGNLSRTSSSNGSLTFPSFCCDGSTINTSQWTTAGTVTVSNGVVTLNAVGESLYSNMYYNSNFSFHANLTASATTGQIMLGWGLCPTCVTWNLDPTNTKYSETRSGATTETNLGAYGTTSAIYEIIWKNTSNVQFYYNNVLLATHTTNIPGTAINASLKVFTIATYTANNIWVAYRPETTPQITAVTSEQQVFYVPIFASDNIKYSSDGTDATSAVSYTKIKEIPITENYTGSWRINFTLGSTGGQSFGKIYKNNVPYGTERTLFCCVATTYSEDFSSIDIIQGDSIQIYAYNVIGGFSEAYSNNFRIEFDYDYANATPVLVSPANNSVQSFAFPPQFTAVTFTWTPIGSSGYQIQIAQDNAFNLIEYDLTTTSATTTQNLGSGTHYWRVRTHNSGVNGNWSDTFNFALTESTPSVNGTAINGVVYEYIGGVQTPVSGASVYLTNTSYTTVTLTGSNGYFLFTGLNNASTYSLYSIKQGYDNSQTFFVTPANNTTTTVNIPMRIFISPYIPNFVFEKFIVRSLFDDPYSGVTVNVYQGSSLSPSFTGVTDSMGQATFQLIKDTYYRVTFSGGGLPTTIERHIFAKEEEYLITVATGFPNTGDKFEDINASLFVTQVNASFANLSLYYNDLSNTTSIINFYALYYNNNTRVCADQSSVVYPVTMNCTVNMVGNLTYVFGWNATTSKYGFIQGADVVDFKATNATAQIPGLGQKIDATMRQWISIFILIFVAGLFSARSIKYGVVIVPFVGVILYWGGMFTISAILVHSALVLGILAYLRMSEQKVIA